MPTTVTRDRTWLVAIAAAFWGTDGLLRAPLAGALPAATVVFWEHLIAVVVLVPFLPSAWRAFRAASVRDRIAIVVIGAGASALATALFTAAFATGDALTPLVLQKLQPLVAVAAAAMLLGERVRGTYWLIAVPALVGAWLVAFPDPLAAQVGELSAAGLAVGAAVLWGLGTVLGRMVGVRTSPKDVTVLRFAIGLPASAVILGVQGAPVAITGSQVLPLVLLALIPGLLALVLYYLALKVTPAARATLAELAFPATATVLGIAFLGVDPSATQWIGLLVVVAAITTLGLRERTAEPVVHVRTG
nr:DMT family transporter [Pseudonocardia pini]